MNVSRLKRLVEILKEIPDESFDIDDWVNTNDDIGPTHINNSIQENIECGYVCCAIGWACLDKGFNETGLTIDEGIPVYNGNEGFEAVSDFFDIATEESHCLFTFSAYPGIPSRDIKPIHVINRIEQLIEGRLNVV